MALKKSELYSSLWSSCDELRGGMDASQYKDTLPPGLKKNQDAVAETIENNVRSKIVKEQLADPAYYETMSALLDEIIAARKAKAIEYEEYLKRIADLMTKLQAGHADDTPSSLNTPGKRALYGLLGQNADLALKVHEAIITSRPDGWRGVQAKERAIKRAIYDVLGDVAKVDQLFPTITAQSEY